MELDERQQVTTRFGSASATWSIDRGPSDLCATARETWRPRQMALGLHLSRHRSTLHGQWVASEMASKQDQEKRNKRTRRQRALGECAPTPGHGMEMPTRPAGLDPIVAEIIETLARTIIRDEDRRASLLFMNE